MRDGSTVPLRETVSPRGETADAGCAGAGAGGFAAAPSKRVRPSIRAVGTGAAENDGLRDGMDGNGKDKSADGTELLNGVNGVGSCPTDPNDDMRTWPDANTGRSANTSPRRKVFIPQV